MKISKIQIPTFVKNLAITAPLLLSTQALIAQTNQQQEDVFIKSEEIDIDRKDELSPRLRVAGQDVYPALVIDLSEKQLYHYSLNTMIDDVFPVDFIKGKIKAGLNLVTVTKHDYGNGDIVEKIYLTPINRVNGKPAEAPTQVLIGENQKYKGRFTNVMYIDNDAAKKITEFLTEEQFVLIRK